MPVVTALSRCRFPAAAVAVWLSVSGAAAWAQTESPRDRYATLVEREGPVRDLIERVPEATPPPASVVTRAGQLMAAYEGIARRYPTSGYADNALWRAASLAETAYQRFLRPDDRDRAVRYYQWLTREYPTSSLVKRASLRVTALAQPEPRPARPPVVPQVARTPSPPPLAPSRVAATASAAPPAPAARADAPATSVPAPAPSRATLLGVQRVTLPDSVRVTLELDQEVTYHEERLGGPARVFFDLRAVQLTPALVDKVLTYPSDVVRLIRVGRHPNNTVRVVLDLEDVSRYSVFALYSPFRLVIDCERKKPATAVPVLAPPIAPEPPVLEARPFRLFATVAAIASPPGPVPAAAPPAPAVAPVKPTLTTVAAPPMAMAAASVQPVPSGPPTPVAPSPPAVNPPSANAAGGFSMARQLGLGISRIVIDPGHGGHDPGAQGPGLNEADLVLDVALRLERLLKKEQGLDVVLTRRSDVYIPLVERTNMANRQNADMFISIHANASRNAAARGIETYFLSFASSPDAEAVAARENAASEREMHHLPDMIKAIALGTKLDESRELASIVQESMITRLRRSNKEVRSLGVKQAPFVVLIGAAMPSVLAEISFVTNKEELQLLKNGGYKDRIAESLQAAVLRYRRSLKGQPAIASQ